MALDEELNSILKEMWRIDEKIQDRQELDNNEKEFYTKNLETIQKYYTSNSNYWNNK